VLPKPIPTPWGNLVNTSLAKLRLASWAGPAAGYGLAVGAVAVGFLNGPLDRDTTAGVRLLALAACMAATMLLSLPWRSWLAHLPPGRGGEPRTEPRMWFFTSGVHGRLTRRPEGSGVSTDHPSKRKL
jgi:hypothetical protein